MMKDMIKRIGRKILPESTVLVYSYERKNEKPHLAIMNAEATIAYIEKTGCSVARFGEGEFELILWPDRDLGFQAHNAQLAKRLEEVLGAEEENLLLCIPYALNDLRGRTDDSIQFWYYWCERKDQRKKIVDLIKSYHGSRYTFGDTQISRPYIAWKTPEHAERIFPRLMGLWKDRDVLIVEGVKTRMGVGNDLFAQARSVKRILGPATNAFDRIEEIKAKVVEHCKGELVIMALGPTATVLALELSRLGIQALDIGHLDIEYEWYRSKATSHNLVPGKYTNEAADGNQVDECRDETYLAQIIDRVE